MYRCISLSVEKSIRKLQPNQNKIENNLIPFSRLMTSTGSISVDSTWFKKPISAAHTAMLLVRFRLIRCIADVLVLKLIK